MKDEARVFCKLLVRVGGGGSSGGGSADGGGAVGGGRGGRFGGGGGDGVRVARPLIVARSHEEQRCSWRRVEGGGAEEHDALRPG